LEGNRIKNRKGDFPTWPSAFPGAQNALWHRPGCHTIAKKIGPKIPPSCSKNQVGAPDKSKTPYSVKSAKSISTSTTLFLLSKFLVIVRGMYLLSFPGETMHVGSLTILRPEVETGVPQGEVSVLLTRWDVDRSFLEDVIQSQTWLMGNWLMLCVFSAFGCNRCASNLANEHHGRFCSFSPLQVVSLPTIILSLVLPATSATFDNHWDPHNTILM
jgi:hypothetical protein